MAEIGFYEFGPFCVDPSRQILLKDGERVALAAKPFHLLVLLIQHRERVLSREELMRAIWPDVSVTNNNFNVTLRAVRRALGESAHNHQYIVTTPEGYRFIATVAERFGAETETRSDEAAPFVSNAALPTPTSHPSDSGDTEVLSQPRVKEGGAEARRKARYLAVALILVLLFITALWFIQAQRGKHLPTASSNPAAPSDPSRPLNEATDSSGQEGKITRLTSHPGRDACPSWSPDGQRIAFVSNREKTTYWGDIWVINEDGSNLRRLTLVPDSPHGLAEQPIWLGHTGDIAILETVNYHEILRFHLSAKPKLPVHRMVEDFESPFFSRLLVVPGRRGTHDFTVTREGERAAWVTLTKPWYTCPTVGVVRTALLSALNGGDALEAGTMIISSSFNCEVQPGKNPFERVSFSPDGSQIVVARNPDPQAYGFDLEVYNLDGTLAKRLTDNGGGVSPIINWNPDWSADNRIAFASNRSGRFEIYTINPDGSGLQQLTFKGGDFPSWSPDSSRIAFQSERDGNPEIYVLYLEHR
jgi:DNA-binding winged helix-turn-helix (wHTH) protein/dipeptidyl aminopeptidase/acylaminoacyl peptidase